MAEVFMAQVGQLTNASKTALRKAGVTVVEVEDLEKVRFVRSSEVVSADDMVWAALDALRRDFGYGNDGAKQREQLAHNLFHVVATSRGLKVTDGKWTRP